MPTHKLTTEIIHAAIEGFESQKRRLDSQIAELRQLLRDEPVEAATASKSPTLKRGMSSAGRRRIAAAQKARWAKLKGASSSPATAKPPKGKRKLSAAGRKAISEASKKRWALKRAAAQKA
jgi:peptidoglycan hydrolase CwlO-like protein